VPTRHLGAQGKLIHGRNLKSKILRQTSFNLKVPSYEIRSGHAYLDSKDNGRYISDMSYLFIPFIMWWLFVSLFHKTLFSNCRLWCAKSTLATQVTHPLSQTTETNPPPPFQFQSDWRIVVYQPPDKRRVNVVNG
jgi:hypothetical protein